MSQELKPVHRHNTFCTVDTQKMVVHISPRRPYRVLSSRQRTGHQRRRLRRWLRSPRFRSCLRSRCLVCFLIRCPSRCQSCLRSCCPICYLSRCRGCLRSCGRSRSRGHRRCSTRCRTRYGSGQRSDCGRGRGNPRKCCRSGCPIASFGVAVARGAVARSVTNAVATGTVTSSAVVVKFAAATRVPILYVSK